ncbi:BTB/POZ domain-containing protein 6-like [Mytilus edulis]|uniref:BTB/POZ domain-containing protein 6-like n=1 Tax=Mytilus edulis TaxID=6550 RepID=UPI0039EFEC8A
MNFMLDNKHMCDITFHVGPGKSVIKAHKYMLASASPVFYKMFEGPLAETGSVEIVDIEPEHFNLILKYIYTDKEVVDSKNIIGLMYGSEKYMIQPLKDQCSKFLSSNVTSDDHACIVYQTAHDFHIEDIKTRALNHIFENGNRCIESTDFLCLTEECLKVIIKSDTLDCREDVLYDRMVKWAKLRCKEETLTTTDENIRKLLGDLLYLIRFPCMKPHIFTEKVSSANILSHEEIVRVYQFNTGQENTTFPSKCRGPPPK